MIPKANTLAVTDTLPGKETEFSIGNAFWVMESLSDLYSNKELAVVREISTNARDANVEAGNADKPLAVTLPTMMNPYFIVKDDGVGMSPEDLEEVYTKFGVSTKRDSNDFNGMLGFGSKAPIAYTGSFTVTTVKDGIKTHAVINKKPDAIVLKVVMTSKTSEPNGVEIKVPVHNHEAFSRIARDFYRFWFPGTVLVDGVEPVQAVGQKISDNLYYSTSGESYVVMGNVGYRIVNPGALFSNSKISSLAFVAFVPNGSVEFVPSREDLKYTDLTKNTLRSVIADFEKKMVAETKSEISKAKTHHEAWQAWSKWSNKLGQNLFTDLTYKGEKFLPSLAINAMRYEIADRTDYYSSRYNTYRIGLWELSNMGNTIIVHKFEFDLNSHHKAKMRQFRDNVDFHFKFVLFAEDEVKSPWVDPKRIVTWEQVKATIPKKPRVVQTGPTRIPGTFDYYAIIDGRARFVWEKELPAGNIMYVTAAENKEYKISELLTLTKTNASIVVLAKNRIAKFTRDNPKTKSFIEHAKSYVVLDGSTLLSSDTKKAKSIGSNTRQWAKSLDVSSILDPRWAAVKQLISQPQSTDEYERHLNLARALKMVYEFKHFRPDDTDESLYEDYPLLRYVGVYSKEPDVYLYMNAKYQADYKGKK